MDNKINVVMLCGDGESSRIMFNGIASHVNIERIVFENKVSSKVLIQRRIKKLGITTVFGQVLFILVNKLLARPSRARISQLILDYGLSDTHPPENITTFVNSINDEETINLLKKINPDAVVVNGTRIISGNVLSSVNAPFINTHMGITPKYRGVHGGYWALAMNDSANCGVTVHLVDQGIDTGGILYQDTIHPNQDDNFNTYPIHQIAKAIPLMKEALDDVREKRLKIKKSTLPSQLWYHPTILDYAKYWIQRGIK
ncbi:MAG: formyl transferase [Burkholderiales bacterium]|nr:hypothetical protein [Nitrosomonas sp.]MCP5276355.1 formyl transferase [Burkholderiales bacterium]